MKNVSRMMSSTLSILLIFGVALSPTLSFAAAAGPSCDSFCGDTKNGIAQLIQDPKCKADPKCVSCVGNTLGNSQIANYCTAYQSTDKSKKKQTVSTLLNYAAGGTCLTSCVMQMVPQTKPAGQALAKVCTGLGLASAAFEIVSALTSNDPAGAVMGAVGVIPGIGQKMAILKTKTETLKNTTDPKLIKNAKSAACMSGVVFLALGVVKAMNAKKMKDAAKSQCDIIGNFGQSASAAVQSCQLGNIAAPPSTGDAGMFAATASSFAAPTLDDGIKQLGVTASDQFIKDMRGDLKTMEDLGKLNLPELAKKVDEGASASDIMGTFGLPPEMSTLAASLESRIHSGEKIPGLDALSGGGYSASGSGTELAGTNTGANEIAFAANTAPGEGVHNVDIERTPASEAQSGLVNDGDILHTAFGGSIFDIISLRIKEQKGKYAEAEPEGRMNRAFNGFSNRVRQPASK